MRSQLGEALNELVTIVHPNTLRRWIGELIVKAARENAWGYPRILGELQKLGVPAVSHNTVTNILEENGLEPGHIVVPVPGMSFSKSTLTRSGSVTSTRRKC